MIGDTRFVRCIKGNPKKVAGIIDRKSVLDQLVNGGVKAALEIRAKGRAALTLHDRESGEVFIILFV